MTSFPLALDGLSGGISAQMDSLPVEFSVIIPARDEEGNISPLLKELEEVLAAEELCWEVIVVDDGSVDETKSRLLETSQRQANLRILSLPAKRGKSAALAAGISVSKGELVGTMDADLQNCPKDFLPMICILRDQPLVTMVQGCRIRRQDSWAKRMAARLGFLARTVVLGDSVKDVGCGIRAFRREQALKLPLDFEGMHRFLPTLTQLQGGEVREIPVDHRQRHSGHSKYHIGLISRGAFGFLDLLAVRWMIWRKRETDGVWISNEDRNS